MSDVFRTGNVHASVEEERVDVLGIPCLNWDDFLGNAPIAAAYLDLRKLTSRVIALHSLSLVPGIPHSFYCAWRGAIHVFIDETSPRVHHSTVHELLHGILVEEGYCKVAARLPSSVNESLSNEMQHPEIFRRMEAYGLEMSPYWSHWANQLREGLSDMKRDAIDPHAGFAHFLQIFTWFYFRQVSEPYLDEYRDYNLIVYRACQAAYEETSRIGFRDARSQQLSLEIFKGHWSRYCDRHLPRDLFGLEIAANIRGSAIRPMVDFVNTRSGDEILCLLRNSGLRSDP